MEEQKTQKEESNKYVRNVLLVLDSIIYGWSGLFSPHEKQLHHKFKTELSLTAQTLFARLLTRKRAWYSVRDHLSNYGEFEQ